MVVLFLFAAIAIATAVATSTFRDVLDLPSAKSRHASASMLIGVTLAGTRIVSVGQHGHIVYSDDQGKNWSQAAVPVSCDLVSVQFPTPQKGWAVGHDGVVLHSSDGGASWVKQFDGRAAAQLMASTYSGGAFAIEAQKISEQGADKPFLDISFENETTGFVVGAFSLIFRTTDGGKSWTPWYDRIDNPRRFHLYAVRNIGQEVYITAEQGTVFKLDQQSGSFKSIKTPYTGTYFGITGKPGALLAFGMRGNAYRSSDNGSNWQKVETGVPVGLMGATVTADGKLVLVSQGGHVLVSTDDGASFMPVKIDHPAPTAGVAAVDKGTVAMVGPMGVKVQSIK
jgi:photosystem II stability/assembly factor-like uncharacterized protein